MRKTFFVVLMGGIVIGFFLRDLLLDKSVAAKVITVHSRGLVFQQAVYENSSQPPLWKRGGTPSLLQREGGGELMYSGLNVYLTPELQVTISDGGNLKTVSTTAETVNDFLFSKNIPLAPTDRVTPPLENYLADNMRITIDRIVDVEETKIQEIQFRVDLVYDGGEYYGREAVVEKGVPGHKEQKYIVTYRNGVEIHRKLISEKITEKPKGEIHRFGTRIEIMETVEGRASWYDYKKCLCAAAPYYPRGRYVRVTSLSSGKSIIVKINDSGPDTTLHPDRVIDLDAVAYKELAPLGSGTIGVKVELLKN